MVRESASASQQYAFVEANMGSNRGAGTSRFLYHKKDAIDCPLLSLLFIPVGEGG